jgi:uncharacterized protein YbcI
LKAVHRDREDDEALSLPSRVSRTVVRAIKDLYGRGPIHVRTYLCDEYIFCVMNGGLTRDEETMIRGGQEEAVREYQLRFQAVIAPELIQRVEDVLGRKVINYHSQSLRPRPNRRDLCARPGRPTPIPAAWSPQFTELGAARTRRAGRRVARRSSPP